ncbi:MAG TPA: hypothetical protein VM936_08400 [Pyrinomonadaceae bacterium]|nr:hypothetical protein [Pyrinomonadaceae bacterium]
MSNGQSSGSAWETDWGVSALTAEDLAVIDTVEGYLRDGIALKRWWERADAANSYARRVTLDREFNRPAGAYGFWDTVQLAGGPLPVMGNVQEMFYDQPRSPAAGQREAAAWMRDQLREFVLHYFMRVSAFRDPEAYAPDRRVVPPDYLARFSLCPQEDIRRQGFGFRQLYYKLAATGEVGKFPVRERPAIIDLREIGTKYEWVVLRVRIYDFNFTFQPFGPGGPSVSVPLNEQSNLIMSREFVEDEQDPEPGVIGRYGLGYAFVRELTPGLTAYGPGEFRAAIETFRFDVRESGEARVRMVFVADRPERVANVPIDPVNWSFGIADLFTFGLTSRLFSPVRNVLDRLPTNVGTFDPVFPAISLLNALTANQAAEVLCISRDTLETQFLVKHFMQHYQTMVGSLITWRQVRDWLDAQSVPEWVVAGRSA